MRNLLLALLPAILSLPHVAASQSSAAAVPSGARMRLFVIDTVDAASGALHYTYPAGRFVALDSGTLVLQSDSIDARAMHVVDTLRVPVVRIGSAESFAGMKRHPVEGAGIGLVVGGFLGFLAGDHASGRTACAAIGNFCVTGPPSNPDTRGRYAAEYGAASGLAGGVIGYLIRSERWSRIDIGRLRLQAGVQP